MRVLMPIFLIAVLGLASCVPVPIPNDYGFYAPDSSDVNFAESNRGGSYCGINGSQPWKRGYRIIGNMKATVWFETVNKDVSNAQGDLYLKFEPIRESDTIVSIGPAKSLPKPKSKTLGTPSESTMTFDGFRSRWITPR